MILWEKEVRNSTLQTDCKKKLLEINLTKEEKDFASEDCRTRMHKCKEKVQGFRGIHIVKLFILPKTWLIGSVQFLSLHILWTECEMSLIGLMFVYSVLFWYTTLELPCGYSLEVSFFQSSFYFPTVGRRPLTFLPASLPFSTMIGCVLS